MPCGSNTIFQIYMITQHGFARNLQFSLSQRIFMRIFLPLLMRESSVLSPQMKKNCQMISLLKGQIIKNFSRDVYFALNFMIINGRGLRKLPEKYSSFLIKYTFGRDNARVKNSMK